MVLNCFDRFDLKSFLQTKRKYIVGRNHVCCCFLRVLQRPNRLPLSSRMLQFSDFEDTDSDIEPVSSFIDDDSGSDEVNFSLDKVWESVSIPVPEEEGIGKRYAVMVKTFYIAKVVRRFLLEANGHQCCIQALSTSRSTAHGNQS